MIYGRYLGEERKQLETVEREKNGQAK